MIKILSIENANEFIFLANEVASKLEKREFLIPCSDDDLKNILIDNNTKVYGYYENDQLVASAQLTKREDYRELGGFLTSPEYRGRGIMKKLCNYIINNNDYSRIEITVHPDNIPSKKVIESLNAKLICHRNIGNFERDVYEIKK